MELTHEMEFPRFVQVETVRACNARCPFCPHGAGKVKAGGPMVGALYTKIERELLEHAGDIRRVTPHLLGEPLLDKDIARRVGNLKRGGIGEVALSTNAELLDETTARALLEAGIDILKMSISSIVPEKYRELRVGLDFDRVMANARRYFKLRNEINPESQIFVTCEKHGILTSADIEEWTRYWRTRMSPRDRLTITDVNDFTTAGRTEIPPTAGAGPCHALFQTMVVGYDGTALLCCADFVDGVAQFPLGDVAESSLAEIWNGKKAKHYRDLHRMGRRDEISLCNGCTIWDNSKERLTVTGKENA